MGLFDFFRRNKNNVKNKDLNIDSGNKGQPDLTLTYKSGTVCEVQFSTPREIKLKDGSIKTVQEAMVTYIEPDGRFKQKKVAMDPKMVTDEQGNMMYDTRMYYKNLANQNMSLVKGFFLKDQLDNIENGYIGHIGVDPRTGAFNRSYEKDVKEIYDEELRNKKIQYNLTQEERFEKELKEQTEKIENMKPHYKDSHAKQLTREDYEQYFGNR